MLWGKKRIEKSCRFKFGAGKFKNVFVSQNNHSCKITLQQHILENIYKVLKLNNLQSTYASLDQPKINIFFHKLLFFCYDSD